jgi:hypothetical protein
MQLLNSKEEWRRWIVKNKIIKNKIKMGW